MGASLLLLPELLPGSIVLDRPLSDEQLEELCAANDLIQRILSTSRLASRLE